MAAASAVYWSIVEKYYFYLLTYTPCYMWLLCRKVRLKRIKSVYVTDPGLSNGSDTFPPAKPPTLIIENAEKSSLINWFFWKVLIQEYGTRVNNDVIHLRWILNLNRPCIVIRLLFPGLIYYLSPALLPWFCQFVPFVRRLCKFVLFVRKS